MSEVKHTPGPWVLQKRGKSTFRIVSSCKWQWDIATVDDDVNCTNGNTDDDGVSFESIANAKLIAAAPDMYEIVKELYEFSMQTGLRGSIFPKLDAVMAKINS